MYYCDVKNSIREKASELSEWYRENLPHLDAEIYSEIFEKPHPLAVMYCKPDMPVAQVACWKTDDFELAQKFADKFGTGVYEIVVPYIVYTVKT